MEQGTDRIANLERRISVVEGRRQQLVDHIEQLEAERDSVESQLRVAKVVSDIFMQLVDQRREFLRVKVEGIVTSGIRAVFGIPYTFFFEVEEKRGTQSMVPRVSLDGQVMDIVNAHGGGLVVVVGFLLRVVTLALVGGKYPVLLLDETFSHVSESYLEPLSNLIKLVTDRLGIQVILVSHQDTLTAAADVVYEVRLVDGTATAARL